MQTVLFSLNKLNNDRWHHETATDKQISFVGFHIYKTRRAHLPHIM